MKAMEMIVHLNAQQKAAVYDDSNACLVKANVGSGKTTVLSTKIAYLHDVKKIPYEQMMVLTFTNRAANEIKARITAQSDIHNDEMCYFGTFHSVALKLLKEKLPVEDAGYTKDFCVMDPQEEVELALHLIYQHQLKIKYKNRLKKRLQDHEKSSQDDLEILKELLNKEKLRLGKRTFDDLLIDAASLSRKTSLLLSWIIVDEVQDCDALQLAFLESIKKPDTSLFAVGDPNQIIYGWRGSFYNIFSKLEKMFSAKVLSLSINYRCDAAILSLASYFQQEGETLQGIRSVSGNVAVKRHYDAFQEAQYLAYEIQTLHKQGIAYEDIAILYRLQSQSAMLERIFVKENVPYHAAWHRNWTEIPVLYWFFKVLRYCANPEDEEAFIYVLTHKGFGEGYSVKKTEKLLRKKDADGSCIASAMMNFHHRSDISAASLYDYFSLDHYLKPSSSSYQENKTFIKAWIDWLGQRLKEKQQTLQEGLNACLDAMILSQKEVLQDDTHSGVQLMTLHACKGLEFSHVFIIGMNQGLLPLCTRSLMQEEEERRLFYVGITRAKHALELSYYIQPDLPQVLPQESIYLRLLGDDLIRREDCLPKTDLKMLKREIQREQEKKLGEETKTERFVKHKKYGEGVVVKEDDMMITVRFTHYGEKEFIKAFSELMDVESTETS